MSNNTNKKPEYLWVFLLIVAYMGFMLLAMTITSCNPDDTPEPRPTDWVTDQVWVYDSEWKQNDSVGWYQYASTSNCWLKFLYDWRALQPTDTLTLSTERDIGATYYVLERIDTTLVEATYHFYQGRETWRGVYNNNAVCDQEGQLFKLHIEVTDALGAHEIGDSIFIKIKQ